ncbi:hypothetical protein 13 [Diadegma semiclausum ichnovirus]|nr:hypothetical protein 13 [Diadegma semiclausum ichnovirus]
MYGNRYGSSGSGGSSSSSHAEKQKLSQICLAHTFGPCLYGVQSNSTAREVCAGTWLAVLKKVVKDNAYHYEQVELRTCYRWRLGARAGYTAHSTAAEVRQGYA